MDKLEIILRTNIVLVLFFGWLGMMQALYAQQVSGTVIDQESGDPLPGVNILVKGTNQGVTTDESGDFSLEPPSLQDTLVVSYIGYKTQNVPIAGLTEIEIVLEPDVLLGEEMV